MMQKSQMPPEGGTMNDLAIDRILSTQADIQPSSGFSASVMSAVRVEATVPPPIPFPWKRAFPIVLLAGATLTVLLILLLIAGVEAVVQPSTQAMTPQLSQFLEFSTSLQSAFSPAAHANVASALAWVGLALALTFASVRLSMRIGAGRA
jgi:hypothetical protein